MNVTRVGAAGLLCWVFACGPFATAGEGASVPPLTDADRAAAFPMISHPMMHASGVHSLVVVDHLEAARDDGRSSAHVDLHGWAGGDIRRLWYSVEGEKQGGESFEGRFEAHYGHGISTWWDVLVGVRRDVVEGEDRSALSAGIHGLAPWFVETAAFLDVDADGDVQFRLSAEYNLLLTNRLILQPDVELVVLGSDAPEEGLGAGWSSLETGLRLRYEFTREFAPYLGVVHERRLGETADRARATGARVGTTRWVAGVRFWF
jgi:copper resistance protein B